ncbi:hypothetical protein KY084_09855 [Stakelama sp. CBK3Z-3]|uniref:Uncharacterized protein n=1 Tax=Stakelama flava TaxID=2860338 RepID=A0ABS6XMQ0_9SPHN|nr:hypothetical protein [Stakelama flava]MBW4331174.1 hypothetical protein [Stakelama flava]
MRLAGALGVVLTLTAAAASAQLPKGVDTPEVVVAGFADTCRSGFPDFDAIARTAAAGGWTERATSVPHGSSLPGDVVLPRMFQKGEAMLALVTPSPRFADSVRACQVTAMAKGKPDLQTFVAQAATVLGLGSPRWEGKGDKAAASWATAAGTVRATIQRYGRVRSYSLQIK